MRQIDIYSHPANEYIAYALSGGSPTFNLHIPGIAGAAPWYLIVNGNRCTFHQQPGSVTIKGNPQFSFGNLSGDGRMFNIYDSNRNYIAYGLVR
ncbi:hypothetical protein [uncultured Pontibacter sp.]|uniref:hypothetical protein n=1 Tax=uncultured Pontibacter sp. TaxID=453356 RepID=UPI0026114803|nr:hypothetical protein [uncultured Pontibacter sp.]